MAFDVCILDSLDEVELESAHAHAEMLLKHKEKERKARSLKQAAMVLASEELTIRDLIGLAQKDPALAPLLQGLKGGVR